jgi:hypothetical protein
MNLHRFGNTRRDVPVIGQGTWYQEVDDPATALGPEPPRQKKRSPNERTVRRE